MRSIKLVFGIFAMMFLLPFAAADLKLDHVQFDPAIIAAGDEVDIVVQFTDQEIPLKQSMIGKSEFRFDVELLPDDSLTQRYVIIQDAQGDDLKPMIMQGETYNKVFRIKVKNDAPSGNYEFKLVGQWYEDGEPVAYERYLRFRMPVKKEGIIMDVANLRTAPAEIRPGDDYVRVDVFLENAGEKDAKSVEVLMASPDGIDPSYSNNNRIWAGRLSAGESKEVSLHVDIDEYAEPGVYDLAFRLNYMDLDNNRYDKSLNLPLLVKERPYLEVVSSEGTAMAGSEGKLYVTLKNTGTESAEAVDVRIIKQNSQPFTFDVRSDYIGELEPGEEGTAVFDIKVLSEAEQKEHNLKLLIRSKGDSDEGDDTIYTYNRRARFVVDGVAPNELKQYGIIGAGLVVLLFGANTAYGRMQKRKHHKK